MEKIGHKGSFSIHNKIKLIKGGSSYFDLINQLIGQAKQTIHFQTYIFDSDETGKLIAEALMLASKRGVKVFLMVDGYASQKMPKPFLNKLIFSGVNFRFFEPFFKSKYFYFGRRMHHKVLVTDATVAVVGGINISNRYNDLPGMPAWLDFALLAEGEIAAELFSYCEKNWKGLEFRLASFSKTSNLLHSNFSYLNTCKVRMRRNDWIKRKAEISNTYADILRNATTNVIIFGSYFLPGKKIRKLLQKASERGIEIKIVTAGKSDIKLAKYAERWLYDWLLRKNIKLYEYQPTVLHAKVATCDGQFFTIGSYNVNNISAYASVELNVDVYDSTFVAAVETELKAIIANNCIPISTSYRKQSKNIFSQFLQWCAYQFIRVSFYLVTFYYKQKK